MMYTAGTSATDAIISLGKHISVHVEYRMSAVVELYMIGRRMDIVCERLLVCVRGMVTASWSIHTTAMMIATTTSVGYVINSFTNRSDAFKNIRAVLSEIEPYTSR